MQAAVPAGVGAIAAVLGLEDDAVDRGLPARRRRARWSKPVNFNSPGQAVIAGHAGAVQRALEACKAAGAKRALLLPMSVPAHSSLMQPAAAGFAASLRAARAAGRPQSRTGARWMRVAMTTVEDIRDCWSASWPARCAGARLIQALAAAGATSSWNADPARCSPASIRRIEQEPAVPGAAGPGRGARPRWLLSATLNEDESMSGALQGEMALVTGASRGIGRAIALRLAADGAKVIGTATSEDGAARISAALAEHGGRGEVLNVQHARVPGSADRAA